MLFKHLFFAVYDVLAFFRVTDHKRIYIKPEAFVFIQIQIKLTETLSFHFALPPTTLLTFERRPEEDK